MFQILFVIIAIISYFVAFSVNYEKTIGRNLPDGKKIILNILNFSLKIPNDINIIKDGEYYKFDKNELTNFLHLFSSILSTFFLLLSIIISPNNISIVFFIKSIMFGLLLSVCTQFLVKILCKRFSKI